MDWIAILSGFGVGAIVGMTGVGGGSLMTPLLLSRVQAATRRWRSAPTCGSPPSPRPAALGAAPPPGHVRLAHHRPAAGRQHPGRAGHDRLMHFTGITKGWAGALTFSLGIALLLTAVVVAYRQAWHARRPAAWSAGCPSRRKPALTVLCGVMLGVLVTLSSIGAGALGATLILLLYPRLPVAPTGRHRHRPRGAADAGGRHRPRHAGPRRLGACSAALLVGSLPASGSAPN